jgi:hypothetical protein
MENLFKYTSMPIVQRFVGQLQKPIVPQPVTQLNTGLLLIKKAKKTPTQS